MPRFVLLKASPIAKCSSKLTRKVRSSVGVCLSMVQCAHLHLALPSVPRPLVTRPCPGPSGVVNEHAPSGQSPNGQAGPALSADLNTPQVSSWPAKFEGLQSRRIEGPYLGLLPV